MLTLYMGSKLEGLQTAEDVASFFGLKYPTLSPILYRKGKPLYREIKIKKKNGGIRTIQSPNKSLKGIQRALTKELESIYKPRSSTHGFIEERSIVTNAKNHLGKKYVFNIDLEDFFGSITFGRLRKFFKAKPLSLGDAAATVLAQICCYKQSLPQGAPTSPILSNMICVKLDNQLLALAKKYNATYSRYCDDITFSFTKSKSKLPRPIISFSNDAPAPGDDLKSIIESNGFKINPSKTRLESKSTRQEVTGITVNEFINAPRAFINQTRAMLHAWEKHGHDAAEAVHHAKHYKKHRASGQIPRYDLIIRGRLQYIKMIRGFQDPLYNSYAKWYNTLTQSKPLSTFSEKLSEKIDASLWVVEVCYDSPDGVMISEGTAVNIHDVGLLTCAHVIAPNGGSGEPHKEIHCRQLGSTEQFKAKVIKRDAHRDIAQLQLFSNGDTEFFPIANLLLEEEVPQVKDEVSIYGFPSLQVGQKNPFVLTAKIAMHMVVSGVDKFAVDALLRPGISGGPLVSASGSIVGIAQKGIDANDTGHNIAICSAELRKFSKSPNNF